MSKLIWEEELDDDDNTLYSAVTLYHDEGSPFYYRVEPVMQGNKILWSVDKSDGELLDEIPDPFESPEAAKAYCEAEYDIEEPEPPTGEF